MKLSIRKISGALVALFISLDASAFVVGSEVTHVLSEPATCRILFRDPSRRLYSACSGTLTSEGVITSAAHCISDVMQKHLSSIIQCGYLGLSAWTKEEVTVRGGHILTSGPKFSVTRHGVKYLRTPGYTEGGDVADIAEIHLDRPIKTIAPIPKTTSASELREFFRIIHTMDGENKIFFKAGVQCEAQGYGLNGTGKGGDFRRGPIKAGKFTTDASGTFITRTTSFSIPRLSPAERESFSNLHLVDSNPANFPDLGRWLESNRRVDTMTTFGDSGGPLYCRLSPASSWKMIATVSRGGNENGPIEINNAYEQIQEFVETWTLLQDQALELMRP